MINYSIMGIQLAEKVYRLTDYQRYKWFLSQFYLAKYELGRENFVRTDCSGILSGALLLAGYRIRASAQYFFDNIFVKHATMDDVRKTFLVAFVADQKQKSCNHLIPHIENDVWINARDSVELTTADNLCGRYAFNDTVIYCRTAPEKVLRAYSKSSLAFTSIDKELSELLGE